MFFFSIVTLLSATSYSANLDPLQVEFVQETDVFGQALTGFNSIESITDFDLTVGFKSSVINGKFVPWIRNYAPLSVGGDAEAQRTYLEAKEAWLEAVGDDVDFRVGNQILAWGSGDLVNPTDVWNASDSIDPFHTTKLPQPIAKLSLHPLSHEHVILDIVASPTFRAHRLPIALDTDPSSLRDVNLTDSRWLIPSPQAVDAGSGVLLPITYKIAGGAPPTDWQTGARLRLVRLLDWDFDFIYAQTTQQMPYFSTLVKGSVNSPGLPVSVTLTPLYYRTVTYGFDASGSISSVGMRFEFAKRDAIGTQPDEIPLSVLWGTFGLDRSFYIGGLEIYVNALFVYKDSIGAVRDELVIGIPSFEPWDRDLVGTLELRFSSRSAIGVRGVSSFVNRDGWIHPFARRQFLDSLNLEVGGDFFVGSQLGVFGQYVDNDRVTTAMTLNF